jgi:hypothetical protein
MVLRTNHPRFTLTHRQYNAFLDRYYRVVQVMDSRDLVSSRTSGTGNSTRGRVVLPVPDSELCGGNGLRSKKDGNVEGSGGGKVAITKTATKPMR